MLGINEVNIPQWTYYTDAPVQLVDNYNTDLEMRATFVHTNSLPVQNGLPFAHDIGLYSVRYTVTDLSGNVSDEAIRTINVGASGVNEALTIDRIMSIYPNPSNGSFVIESYSAGKQVMQLFDVTGKLVLTQNLQNEKTHSTLF